MSKTIPVVLPDIGNFENVDVIEVLVAVGDAVAREQSILTLETDKATMEVPSPAAGKQYSVGVGWGNYESQNAFALGGKAQITPEFQLTAGWGYSNEGNAFNIGAGYSW